MTEAQLINKLNELRSLPAETEVVEFKTAANNYDFKKIGKYFSALCNEANLNGKSEAWLIFGIENEHRNNRITFIDIYELNLPEGLCSKFHLHQMDFLLHGKVIIMAGIMKNWFH